MVKICLLEDEQLQTQRMKEHLARFQKQHADFEYTLETYDRAILLLDHYKRDADLLFLDIRVPDMLGMDMAKQIREIDQNVMIIFVTNLAQYAIEGYTVGAFDYILKPLNYFSFEKKLERALRVLSRRFNGVMLDLKTREGGQRIAADSVTYIEVSAHDIYVHTDKKVIKQWGTLSRYEKLLKEAHFSRCCTSFLVNLKYVKEIRRDQVIIAGATLSISRSRRKEFLNALAQYKGVSL